MQHQLAEKNREKTYEKNITKKYFNYKILLYLTLTGLTFMFLCLTFLYYVSQLNAQQSDLKIGIIFYLNSFILLASSICVIISKKYYRYDNYTSYKTSLIIWLTLGTLFIFGQFAGWISIYTSGYNFQHQSASYLYIISGLHALHIIGGLVFLIFFMFNSWKTLKDYATSVVYFTDPVAKSQLNLLGTFWHYLGIMWLYLLLFFIIIK